MFTRLWGLCFYSNSFVRAFNSLINLILIGLGMKRKFWIKLQLLKVLFDIFSDLEGENNYSFSPPPPIPSMQCCAAVRATFRNNKPPNFEWRRQGRGVDYFVLWSYPIWVQCLNDLSAIVGWRQSIKTVIFIGQAEGLLKKLSDVLHCF